MSVKNARTNRLVCVIFPSLTVGKIKNGYKPSKHGLCSRFSFRNDIVLYYDSLLNFRKNTELFEEAFYEKKNLDPQMHVQQENNIIIVADEVDPELLAKVLENPEM